MDSKTIIEITLKREFPLGYSFELKDAEVVREYVKDYKPIYGVYVNGHFIGNIGKAGNRWGYSDQQIGAVPLFQRITKQIQGRK